MLSKSIRNRVTMVIVLSRNQDTDPPITNWSFDHYEIWYRNPWEIELWWSMFSLRNQDIDPPITKNHSVMLHYRYIKVVTDVFSDSGRSCYRVILWYRMDNILYLWHLFGVEQQVLRKFPLMRNSESGSGPRVHFDRHTMIHSMLHFFLQVCSSLEVHEKECLLGHE